MVKKSRQPEFLYCQADLMLMKDVHLLMQQHSLNYFFSSSTYFYEKEDKSCVYLKISGGPEILQVKILGPPDFCGFKISGGPEILHS